MKVLIVTNDLTGENGYSTYALNIIEPLIAGGSEVLVALQEKKHGKNIIQHKVFSGGTLAYLWQPLRIFKAARKLQLVIDKENPDVIHFVVEPYQTTLAFLKIPPTLKIVLTVHGTYTYIPEFVSGGKRIISQIIYWLSHKKIDTVVAVSNSTKKRYLQKNGSLSRLVTVIHNATNVTPSLPEVVPKENELYHTITIGEVKDRKGIKEAIESLSTWSRRNSVRVVYDVVGNYHPNSKYVRLVNKLAKESSHDFFSVVFHGRVTNEAKDRLLKQASVYMHLEPNIENGCSVEGFGIGIIDAAAYGVPAIVSRGTATEEAIIDGKTGFAVNPKDIESVCDRISDILENSLDSSSIESWAKSHSVSSIFKQIKALYDDN